MQIGWVAHLIVQCVCGAGKIADASSTPQLASNKLTTPNLKLTTNCDYY